MPELGVEAFGPLRPFIVSIAGEPGPEEPRPVSATITYAEEAVWHGVIPRSGGTVAATGPDGTSYSLTISATALLTDVEITMTPISSVSLSDDSGSAAPSERAFGVQLEPEGLHLFDAASLRIEPIGVDTAGWVGLATGFGGSDLHRYPMLPGADVATLPITHFSNYVVAKPTGESAYDSIPSDIDDQLEVDLAEALEDGRLDDNEQEGISEKYLPAINAILDGAAEDCAFAERGALARVRSMVEMLEAVGYGDVVGFSASIRELFLAAILNCIREVTEERCFAPENLSHVQRLIGLAEWSYPLGGPKPNPVVSAALAGKAPGTALCGDVVGIVTWGNVTQGNGGSDFQVLTDEEGGTIEVNLDRGGPDGFVDRGSRYSYSYRATHTVDDAFQCTGTITTTGEGGGAISEALNPYIMLALAPSLGQATLFASGVGAGHTSSPEPDCGSGGPHERLFGISCPGTQDYFGVSGTLSADGGFVRFDCNDRKTQAPGIFEAAYASGLLILSETGAPAP